MNDSVENNHDQATYLELVSLLDELGQSIRELEETLERLRIVHRSDIVLLGHRIAERKMKALAWRLVVTEMEATRLDQQNWASY